MERLKISRVLVVEGRYDAARLRELVEGTVITTGGFGIFHQREKIALLRRLAAERGLVILTDSDAAGFQIRGFLKGAIPPEQMVQVYIPDVPGKERRKAHPSKEGKLGVEGMDAALLRRILTEAGVTAETTSCPPVPGLTKADLYARGLSGGPESAARRDRVLRAAGLPARMTADQMLEMLNLLYPPEERERLLAAAETE